MTYEELEAKVELLTKKLALYDKLDYKLRTEHPERSGVFFICGIGGKNVPEANDLPEYLSICPAYGVSHSFSYELQLPNKRL